MASLTGPTIGSKPGRALNSSSLVCFTKAASLFNGRTCVPFYTDLHLLVRLLYAYNSVTPGMVRNAAGVLAPLPDAMERSIRRIVTMHDEEYSRVGGGDMFGKNFCSSDSGKEKSRTCRWCCLQFQVHINLECIFSLEV